MTTAETLTVTDADGVSIFVYHWPAAAPKAVVHIVHGLGEHSARCARLATVLHAAGYNAYAEAPRCHGRPGVA